MKRTRSALSLLLALTILMPVYAAEEHFEGVNLYATYVVAAATFVGLIITTTSLIIKNKHNY